jgi:hypothetical protein
MRKFRWFSALAMLALAACGDSAGNCTSSFTASCGSTTPTTVAKLMLLTDLAQVPSDGSKTATITAQALDSNNNVMTGVVVVFQASSGALIPTQPTTDAAGLALASLGAGSDPSNRTITVTGSVGSTIATVPVTVNGTTLALSGPPNLVLGNAGDFTVVLTNSAGQGIAGAVVTLTSSLNNTLTPAATTTDTNGRLAFTLTAANGGTDTITATALGQTQTAAVNISTQSFNITAPASGTQVSLGASQTVTVTWLNNGAPVVGQPVTFAATRGTLAPTTPVTTDASGHASVSISSLGAGPAVIDASGTNVSAQLNINFVADNPSQISLQAGPASVNVQGNSTITALVRDAANNLVQGATVTFQITADPTNGGLSTATAVTNAQGIAQTVYTAGNSSSGANGVIVTGSVNAKGGAPTYTSNATLTVGGQTVFLSMGTGNSIVTDPLHLAIYEVPYTVFAVDSNGAPLQNVAVTLKILPVAYGKGVMGGCPSPGPNWVPVYSTDKADPDNYNGTTMCKNEDTDYTGNINSLGLNGSGLPVKDYNTSTKLEPGNVAVVSPSSGTTDANGRLDVTVTYPKDHAYWVWETLIASTTVQGTESSTSSTFVLQGAITDYACSVGPPGPVSPYGVGVTCDDPN